MTEFLKCCFKTLSPVHLGCDEVYEPTGFVVDEEENRLVVFDTATFLAELEETKLQTFSAICKKGTLSSILEIYNFLRNQKPIGRYVAVSKGFVSHYRKTLDISGSDERRIQQELNRFTISRTAFLTSTDRPYIPGSAVKGAMRTAYLNLLARSMSSHERKNAKVLEQDLLDGGSFDTDPFRMLKVSDFMPIGEIKTKILYAVNEKKKPSQFAARGPYQILEVILPGAEFEGSITLETTDAKSNIRKALTLETLFGSLKDFYLSSEKTREHEELVSIGVDDSMQSLDGALGLLRVGRHSGAESVTIEPYRQIRIMGEKGKPPRTEKNATTLWLAADHDKPSVKKDLKPFGWALLAKIENEQVSSFAQRETTWRKENESERSRLFAQAQDELATRAEQARIVEALARNKQLEEEHKLAEDAARKEAMARMSPEEKAVEELSDPRTPENRIYEIYNQIDTFKDQQMVAMALKEVWVKTNKWTKKRCTPKQWTKVKRVKEILGEN